jgi:hypothetical protein
MNEQVCLNCGKSEQETPLLQLTFRGEAKQICAQCLPFLIHKPHQLVEKLPGFNPPATKPGEH